MTELSDSIEANERVLTKVEEDIKGKSAGYIDGYRGGALRALALFEHHVNIASDEKKTIEFAKSEEWAWLTQGPNTDTYKGFSAAWIRFVPLLRAEKKCNLKALFWEVQRIKQNWSEEREKAREAAKKKAEEAAKK